jgi:hypothetical protein
MMDESEKMKEENVVAETQAKMRGLVNTLYVPLNRVCCLNSPGSIKI